MIQSEIAEMVKKNPELLKNNPELAQYVDPKVTRAVKYHNRNTVLNDRVYQSGREASRAAELQVRERANDICNLCYQVMFDISPPGHRGTPVVYIADFVYIELPLFLPIVEDAKGMRTDEYKLKKKFFEAKYSIRITEV